MIADVENVFSALYAKIKGDIRQGKVTGGQIEKTILLIGFFPYIFVPIALFVIFKAVRDGAPS